MDAEPDEVGKFWVVTHATDVSELDDIMFQADVADVMLQARGGLDPRDAVFVGKSRARALVRAEQELRLRLGRFGG